MDNTMNFGADPAKQMPNDDGGLEQLQMMSQMGNKAGQEDPTASMTPPQGMPKQMPKALPGTFGQRPTGY